VNTYTVVVGATGVDYLAQFKDPVTQALINITGATSVRLGGASADLPSNPIDQAGAIFDGPNGIAKWTAIGSDSYVSMADMGSRDTAVYLMEPYVIDVAAKKFYGERFQIIWIKPVV
jgi:hypothetical protein